MAIKFSRLLYIRNRYMTNLYFRIDLNIYTRTEGYTLKQANVHRDSISKIATADDSNKI